MTSRWQEERVGTLVTWWPCGLALPRKGAGSSSSESWEWRGKMRGLLIRLEVSRRGNEQPHVNWGL